MDAVEIPLPANVVVSKLLASEVFGRIGESEARDADAAPSNADACVYGTLSASPGSSSFRREMPLSLSAEAKKKAMEAVPRRALPADWAGKKRKLMKDEAAVGGAGESDQPRSGPPTAVAAPSIVEAKLPSSAPTPAVSVGKSAMPPASAASVSAASSSTADPTYNPNSGEGNERGPLYPMTNAQEIFLFLDTNISTAALERLSDPDLDSAAANLITTSMSATVRAAFLVSRFEARHIKDMKAFHKVKEAYLADKEKANKLSAELNDLHRMINSVKYVEEHNAKLSSMVEERAKLLLEAETKLAIERSDMLELGKNVESVTVELQALCCSIPQMKSDAVNEYVNSDDALVDFMTYYKQGFEECRAQASEKFPNSNFSSLKPLDEEEESPKAVGEVQQIEGPEIQGDAIKETEIQGDVPKEPEVQGDVPREPEIQDIKHPALVSENGSFPRKKENVGLNESLHPILKHEGNGKQLSIGKEDNSAILLLKHEGKQLIRKSLKKSNSSPCSKRPRIDQPESSIGSHLTKCTSEKLRGVTKKRGQDGKRGDKRNFRVAVKNKFDSFISKNGLASCDSATGGNNILGIYGLKSDLCDVTKNVAELPLDELLNGSYKYPNQFQDKGKRSPGVNETIVLSVKKACSILAFHKSTDSSGNRKVFTCPLSSNSCLTNIADHCDEDNCIEESVPSSKDSSLATLRDSSFYQPKDIFERLALPLAQDLDALILDSGMPSVPFQSTTSMESFQSASLPPFPWSSSHSGPCKPTADACKYSTSRNTCQGRWIRIGSSSRLIGRDHSFSSELDFMTYDHTEDPSKPKKFDDLFQDMKTLTMAGQLPYDKTDGKTCILTRTSESNVSENKVLNRVSGMRSYNSLDLNFMEMHSDSSDRHLKFGSKDPFFLRSKEDERSVLHERNEPKSVNRLTSSSQIQETDRDSPMRSTHCCSDSNCYYPCKSTSCQCKQYLLDLPTTDISKPEYSPRLLAAAETLYQISSYSRVNKKQYHDSEKIRCPNTTSHTFMKYRKSRPSVGKTNGLSQTARPCDPIKIKGHVPSPPQKLMMIEKKNKLISMDNVGRGPIRWPVPMERPFPDKSERDLAVDRKQFHGGSSRFLEKGDSGHERFRKGSATTSSGTFVKDWCRGRSKKE